MYGILQELQKNEIKCLYMFLDYFTGPGSYKVLHRQLVGRIGVSAGGRGRGTFRLKQSFLSLLRGSL